MSHNTEAGDTIGTCRRRNTSEALRMSAGKCFRGNVESSAIIATFWCKKYFNQTTQLVAFNET